MAIERILAADLLMNLSVLLCVQAGLGRLHFPSTAKALAILCSDTAIEYLFRPRYWSSAPVQGMICILCGAVISGSRRPRRFFPAAVSIFCASASAAGFAALSGSAFPAAAAGLIAFGILLRSRRSPTVRWNIEVTVWKCGIRQSFTALIDTGNRLREHRSGLPVLIAEESAVPEFSALLQEMEDREIRTLGFGVLGSAGEMRCFRPDRLYICDSSGYMRTGPECWIGIFEGHIPGRTRALAPPEFAEYSEASNPMAAERLRRITHAIFNRQTIHLRPRCTDQARLGLLHRRQ